MQKYLLLTILILCISLAPIGKAFTVEKQGMDSMSERCLKHMNDIMPTGEICDSDECFQTKCLSLGSGASFFGSNKLAIDNNRSFDYRNRYLDHLQHSMPFQVYRPLRPE
jgi:hypothetical protein